MMMHKWLILGAVVLACGVALGAFGAHGLKSKVPLSSLEIWHTAVSYLMYHGYVFFIVPLLARMQFIPDFAVSKICALFFFGILIFSGSLCILVLSGIKILGAITPIGGVSLIAGWCYLAYVLSTTHR